MREREDVLEEFGLMEYDGSIWQIHNESVKSRGAYGATVCAMADRIRELEALAAAPRVRVLDEWRVTDKDGMLIATFRTEDDANRYRVGLDDDDEAWPQYAPHRVVRVALVEVDDV